MPYRSPSPPEPEPPDPAVDAYGRRAAADRRRLVRGVVFVGLLLALVGGAVGALRVARERRLVARWREVLECLDDGADGDQRRIRARQLAAIGNAEIWPSRCERPLRALAAAADDVDHRVLASSARELALLLGRDDPDDADLVPPMSRLIDDALGIGLLPLRWQGTEPAVPLLSELAALPPSVTPDGSPVCVVAEDGRGIACGVGDAWRARTTTDTRLWSLGRDLHLVPGTTPRKANDCANVTTLVTLADGSVALWSCDAQGTFHTEEAGVVPSPRVLVVGNLGTKVVLVWVQSGGVGGIRMRTAERGPLTHAETRVIVDERAPGADPVGELKWFEGNGYGLLVLMSATGRAHVLRVDANGTVSNITVSSDIHPL